MNIKCVDSRRTDLTAGQIYQSTPVLQSGWLFNSLEWTGYLINGKIYDNWRFIPVRRLEVVR